jgi:hypothetical protein
MIPTGATDDVVSVEGPVVVELVASVVVVAMGPVVADVEVAEPTFELVAQPQSATASAANVLSATCRDMACPFGVSNDLEGHDRHRSRMPEVEAVVQRPIGTTRGESQL